MVSLENDTEKFRWIMKSGWKGLCPRCGKGHMFTSWLKVAKKCDVCGLDHRFATPDDGPAFFSLCIVAFPLTFLLVWIEVAYNPPFMGPPVHVRPDHDHGLPVAASADQGMAGRIAICKQGAGSWHRHPVGQTATDGRLRRAPAISMTDAWLPDLSQSGGAKYQAIADALDIAISRGELRKGDRLPPQREVAARLGVDLDHGDQGL